MKYANFCDTGRPNINIGDYLQFMATDYLYQLMDVPPDEIIYLGFKDLNAYDGEEVIFPFCYSVIDFVIDGKIAISKKIKPIFFSVTLSTIDKFMNLDEFLSNDFNRSYFLKYGPVGCRDEITYNLFSKYQIPAYINGCMTAVFPRYSGRPGDKVLFADAPKALLPFIPDSLLEHCEFSTQQYNFNESDIRDYRKIFQFVNSKYSDYKQTARLAITSRLHVALPLAAFGIPVILAKDNVDGRFSFIEKYLPIFSKENYGSINWTPGISDFEDMKELLLRHALGRIQNNEASTDLEKMEGMLTGYFKSRTVNSEYKESYTTTHNNGFRFDEYSCKYWKQDKPIRYALWGASKNNAEYWKNYIESKYPYAKLTAVFDSFRNGELLGLPLQPPIQMIDYDDIHVIVCSVGAAGAAPKLFKELNIDISRYCVTSDCFITKDDIEDMRRSGIYEACSEKNH